MEDGIPVGNCVCELVVKGLVEDCGEGGGGSIAYTETFHEECGVGRDGVGMDMVGMGGIGISGIGVVGYGRMSVWNSKGCG